MIIEVYHLKDPENYIYESVGLIEGFKSLRVIENFVKPNEFTLQIQMEDNLEMFRPDNVLKIEEVNYFIERQEIENGMMEIKGKSISGRLSHRIIQTNYNRSAKPEAVCVDLLNKYNNDPTIKNLLPSSFSSSSIRYQNSYGNLLEAIETLSETHQFGFREYSSSVYGVEQTIEFIKGKDHSDWIEFSIKNENLLSESYEHALDDWKTTAYVLGEGEGSARRRVILGDSAKGANRREIYVDARDLQSEGMTNTQYDELLRQRGLEKLSAQQPILTLSGEINPNDQLYRLNEDYQVGDIVMLRSENFGLKQKIQLTSIQKTWDQNGYHIDPQFGKASPTILDKIRRG